MTNSIQNVLLGDRVLIGAVSDTFVTNIQLRLKSGVSGFKLENANIEPVFCSSINKHTCACRVSNDNGPNNKNAQKISSFFKRMGRRKEDCNIHSCQY